MSLVIRRIGIRYVFLSTTAAYNLLFSGINDPRALGMTFQPIPMNLIYRYSDKTGHIHQNIQIPQQSFHHMPYSMLTHITQPPTSSNQLLTSPCSEWNCATSVNAARDAHNRSSYSCCEDYRHMSLHQVMDFGANYSRYHTVHSPFGSPGNQKIARKSPPRSQNALLVHCD